MNLHQNRRDFLKTSAAAIAVAALDATPLGTRAWAAPTNKRGLRKGVSLGMIKGNESILDKFKLLKDLGFDGIELDYPNGPDKKQILAARDATGIAIGNIIDSIHWNQTLSDPDPAVRARGLAGLQQALRDAKELGCPAVLLVAGVVNKKVSYADAYTRSQAEIRKVVPLAEELGVKIAIENVWNHFLLSPIEAARYVDELNSPAVGWHFDVGNVVTYGWPEQWVQILNKRIVTLHIKEFSRERANKEGLWKGFEVELLEGDNDWPAVMKALDEVGFHGWSIAEIPGGDAARLKNIAERMDRILAS
ncbi:MAG: sugar phosphate isomerase/epimerase family protein [Limisphaerales bacterium]